MNKWKQALGAALVVAAFMNVGMEVIQLIPPHAKYSPAWWRLAIYFAIGVGFFYSWFWPKGNKHTAVFTDEEISYIYENCDFDRDYDRFRDIEQKCRRQIPRLRKFDENQKAFAEGRKDPHAAWRPRT